MSRYKIESTGNGLCVTITRLADNATAFLQGDDAAQFMLDVDASPAPPIIDHVCDDYTDLFQTPKGAPQS